MKAKLTFHGGAGRVTGSNFLLELPGAKLLIDCGFFQGCDVCSAENLEAFQYDPASLDFLYVTHAHIDHIGRIPKLVKDGFRGKIFSTPPTKDITELMLIDSIEILEEESRRGGRPLIYTEKDVRRTFALWETVEYHEKLSPAEGVEVVFKDAGHILGSAMVEIKRGEKKLVFTGDLGNSPAPLLRPTEDITDATYLVMESVYGDRNHEDKNERKEKLEDIIEDTIRKKGVLIIPAFSVERTQEILFEIETMMREHRIPLVPVFLDSPLAIQVTEVYKRHETYFNKDVKDVVRTGDEIFKFPQLQSTRTPEESKQISDYRNPKIIIAGSGMSSGGRVLFHEKNYLPGTENALLFVGYQAPESLGREIQDGAKKVVIHGDTVPVRARIETIRGYSAHKDMNALLDFVSRTADSLEKAFVVIGEPRASAFLAQRIRDYMGVDARVPREGESVELDL